MWLEVFVVGDIRFPWAVLRFFGLAVAALVLLGSAAAGAANLHDEAGVWDAQSAELAANAAVFAIVKPETQPPGEDLAFWDLAGYDGTHHFRVRMGADGSASLSDPYEPTAVVGRKSGSIVPCSSMHVQVYETHPFTYDGKSYRALLTTVGNAVVCSGG